MTNRTHQVIVGRREIDNYLLGLMWKGKNQTNPYDLVDGTTSLVSIHIGRDTNYNRGRRSANFNERWNFNVLNGLKLHHGRLDEKGGWRLGRSQKGYNINRIK